MAQEDLQERIYAELRRLAAWHLKKERPGHTLQPTALVNEAYLRLTKDRQADWQAKTKFMFLASREMRRVLLDHHRKKVAQKRAGRRVTLREDAALTPGGAVDFLALNEALETLSTLNERQAKVVECRFLSGMSVEETAEALGIAVRTVKQDWTLARIWLARELRHISKGDD